MADSKISALTSITGENLDPAADVFVVVDTSTTTTKKILAQDVFDAASTLTALTGAGTDATADSIPIYDNSATAEKKILVEELGIALNATQAGQEAGTSTKTLVSPAVQKYHPSAAKCWGLITPNTTVTLAYPGSGVSVVKNSTGDYSVTHGVTFSSANYAAVVVGCAASTIIIPVVKSRTATVLNVVFFNDAFANVDPTSFSYQCFGDL